MPSEPLPTIARASGVTPAERYLQRLCDCSFLSLWSYPSIFRDQKANAKGDGKELCDLLVVFGDDILIFSDKSCAFPETGDIYLDWSRWYRKAILRAAEQAWGAERWIREHPDRLFLDRACTQPFPLDLPSPERARFHHIVVAHNIAERSLEYFGGGSGTLVFDSDVTTEQQSDRSTCNPFNIGLIDADRAFVHVLEDVSLDIVLTTCDTISDFLHYLRAKEGFLRELQNNGTKIFCAGEEEFLAQYFLTFSNNQHGFISPDGYDFINFPEGAWRFFRTSPERAAQLEADQISYSWDSLIEKFNENVIGGTSYYTSNPRIGDREKLLRFFAREPRVRRRLLAEALIGLLKKATPHQRAIRLVCPSSPGDPHYCFLLLPKFDQQSYDEYREFRRKFLEICCSVTKLVCPDAQDIIALATENGMEREARSEDALYLDVRLWNDELEEQARVWQKQFGLLVNLRRFDGKVLEFPIVSRSQVVAPGPNPRNKLCPCGSGKKYKVCHGQ